MMNDQLRSDLSAISTAAPHSEPPVGWPPRRHFVQARLTDELGRPVHVASQLVERDDGSTVAIHVLCDDHGHRATCHAEGETVTGRLAHLQRAMDVEDPRLVRALTDVLVSDDARTPKRSTADRGGDLALGADRLQLDSPARELDVSPAEGPRGRAWGCSLRWCSKGVGQGEVTVGRRRHAVTGRVHHRRVEGEADAFAWVALDDGTELLAVRRGTDILLTRIAPDGTHASAPCTLTPSRSWQSTRTFFEYDIAFRLDCPELDTTLKVAPTIEDQEVVDLSLAPALWMGRVRVTGRLGAASIDAGGWAQTRGRGELRSLETYFRAVGGIVRRSVAVAIPRQLDRRRAAALVAGEGREHYLDGLDLGQLAESLLHPIREITDRGGKGWRSYAAIACCELVGGDARPFVDWLAMPELMHVGSLIVDDVQDRSEVRRGGPACHRIHGEPLAINAGTAAYFLTQRMLASSPHLSDAVRLEIYDLYFEAMRAGHAGQAIDLSGLERFLPEAVASGDGAALERRVLAVHRLKTAAPAACLARMGALAGGGTRDQVEAVGRFFEAVGMAFQIIDDVLNLRGFDRGLKTRGEDIAQGKVTVVVAKAMTLLDQPRRRELADLLASRPDDRAVIDGAIAQLEACGALAACEESARALVEDAWAALDPLVETSFAKVMLRAFGWFVLERHY